MHTTASANGALATGSVGRRREIVDRGVVARHERGVENINGAVDVGFTHRQANRIHELHGRQHPARRVEEHGCRNTVRFEYAARDMRFGFVRVFADHCHRFAHEVKLQDDTAAREGVRLADVEIESHGRTVDCAAAPVGASRTPFFNVRVTLEIAAPDGARPVHPPIDRRGRALPPPDRVPALTWRLRSGFL